MDKILFDNIEKLGSYVLSAVMVYVLIVATTKIFGKRSTSQLNNFDWTVTVMVGSMGASIILFKAVPVIEGGASILTLYVLQFLVTKYASISPQFSNVILSEPRIVFYQGQYLPDAMREERLTRQELINAMRSEGVHSLSDIETIVFESDATLTVMTKKDNAPNDTLSETLLPII